MNALSPMSTSDMIRYIQTHFTSHHIVVNGNHLYGRKKAALPQKYYNFQLTFLKRGGISLKIGTRPRTLHECNRKLLDTLKQVAEILEGEFF